MVAYSFQRRFETPIMAGTKRQTIRAVGKRRHARKGDELQLYVGMRTKAVRLLKRELCKDVCDVAINFDAPSVLAGGMVLTARSELDGFARMDGFSGWAEFIEFWSEEHFKRKAPEGVWSGVMVRW